MQTRLTLEYTFSFFTRSIYKYCLIHLIYWNQTTSFVSWTNKMVLVYLKVNEKNI